MEIAMLMIGLLLGGCLSFCILNRFENERYRFFVFGTVDRLKVR